MRGEVGATRGEGGPQAPMRHHATLELGELQEGEEEEKLGT